MQCLTYQAPRASLAAWPGIDGLTPLALLGGGGGGMVWGCVDRAGELVAVKIAASREARRLDREIAAQRRVGAPTAPRLIDRTMTADGRVAVVMEWLEGETLAARLAGLGGKWPMEDVAAIASALAARIDAIHAAGIAHRDLKPSNLWLEPSGAVRLLDFGLAWLERADDDWDGTRGDIVGTPYYMAPEQARGDASGAPADIYSFGAIVFELIAGRPPFIGVDVRVAHASRRAPVLSEHAPHAAVLDDVIAVCLAKRVDNRPRTAGEVAQRIAMRLGKTDATVPGTIRRRETAAPATRAVALLGAPAALELQAVATAASAAGGIVARVGGDGFVVAFPGVSPAKGLASARELAASLAVAATLHVAELTVRTGARGVRVSGAAVAEPAAWWTAGLTAEARAVVDVPERSRSESIGDMPAVDLVGRDGALATIVESAIAAVQAARSATITIVGVAGLGKTRLLDEAMAAIAKQLPDAPVVAVDDVHRLDASTLDVLERRQGVVIAAAHPALYERRPLWGDRADATFRIDLAPLDEAPMFVLLRSLLAPVEYVAEPALRALAELAHGVPAHAVEIVRQLRAIGATRQSDTGGWYLAADELLQLSATDGAKRLAARVLAELAPDVQCFARIAAVLGEGITPNRLEAIRLALGYQVDTDAGVALERLAAEQLVMAHAECHRVRSELLRDAIVDTIGHGERAELHRAALAILPADELTARARHARGAGEVGLAAELFVALGDEHRAACRDSDAERAYTAAMELATDPAARGRALDGRGRVRVRLQRLADADADFAAAELLVTDDRRRAAIQLERATVADWSERWQDAVDHVARAETAARDHELDLQIKMARGRAAFRAGDLSSARTLLVEAAGARDHDTSIIARLKLSSVLSAAGELERAHTILDEVIATCEASSDRLHHCVALNNRMLIWAKRNDLDGSIADQRAATELARIIGHAHVERSCTYNLAELLLWGGCTDEALPLAQRSRSLQRRFVGPSPLDALLIARIRAARDELADAAAELAWIDEECESLDGASAMQRTLIGLVVSGTADRAAWEGVIEAARTMNQFYELHEALWFAARTARRAGNEPAALSWIDEGLRLPGSNAVWTTRFQAIASVEDK